MPYQATIYRVMIASPSDVSAERDTSERVIHEWNAVHSRDRGLALLPARWETDVAPGMGEPPQQIINRQLLADADLLIAVFWKRLGTPTGAYASGTVEEINRHVAAGKPAMLYFSNAAMPVDADLEQIAAVRKFHKECMPKGIVETFESLDGFRHKLTRHLMQKVIECFSRPSGTFAKILAIKDVHDRDWVDFPTSGYQSHAICAPCDSTGGRAQEHARVIVLLTPDPIATYHGCERWKPGDVLAYMPSDRKSLVPGDLRTPLDGTAVFDVSKLGPLRFH